MPNIPYGILPLQGESEGVTSFPLQGEPEGGLILPLLSPTFPFFFRLDSRTQYLWPKCKQQHKKALTKCTFSSFCFVLSTFKTFFTAFRN